MKDENNIIMTQDEPTQRRLPQQRRRIRNRTPSTALCLVLTTLCLCTMLPTTTAVPPKFGTNLTETPFKFESMTSYRQRLGLPAYQYRPRLISPEMCRNLTEAECEKHDLLLQEHGRNHQAIQKKLYQQRRRRLDEEQHLEQQQQQQQKENKADFQHQLGAFTKAYESPDNQPTREEELAELEVLLTQFNTTKEQHYRRQRERRDRRNLQGSDRANEAHNPSVGIFVVPILLVRFTDHLARELPDKYEYQILWNLRIRKWIDENSYGKYEAFFDVQDWITTDNTEKHYAAGTSGRVATFQDAYFPALNAMDAALGGDWSLYDVDGDGILDNLICLHSGYGAEEAGNDCSNDRSFEDRIWSHAFSAAGTWTSSNGQYTTKGYMIASSLDLVCDFNPALMGVMTHEYLHTFFLIDLYDTNFNGKGVGNYDIMAYPYGMDNTGYTPVHLSAWAKKEIEWQTCTEITADGEFTLTPAATSESCYYITLLDFTPWAEYILLENRQQSNFDINFFTPGLVMYHIDDAADDQSYTGYPGIDDYWPDGGDHYRVAVLGADGNYDLETGENNGDEGDIWQPGMKLTPNTDGATFPNTDSYQQGYIESTGITVEVLESQGLDVSFKVSFATRSFNTPMKERDTVNGATYYAPGRAWTESLLAREQFDAGDSPHQISGKIPQLPWYEEWQAEQASAEVEAEAATRSGSVSTLSSVTILAAILVASSFLLL